MPIPAAIAHSMQQTQVWLKELRDNGDLANLEEALTVLRVVLHQLRDRLTVAEAVDLGAQLPIVIRGIYYEGWKPAQVPHKVHNRQKFIDETLIKLLPLKVHTERAIRDVFAILAHHCDPGEISDVIGQMPEELKGLWTPSAQTYRARTRS